MTLDRLTVPVFQVDPRPMTSATFATVTAFKPMDAALRSQLVGVMEAVDLLPRTTPAEFVTVLGLIRVAFAGVVALVGAITW